MMRYGNHTVGPIRGGPLLIANARRLARPEMISTTAVFGGMDCQDAFAPASLLDPDQGIAGKPVMRVDSIEWTDIVLGLYDMMDKRPAHVVDLVDEIRMQ